MSRTSRKRKFRPAGGKRLDIFHLLLNHPRIEHDSFMPDDLVRTGGRQSERGVPRARQTPKDTFASLNVLRGLSAAAVLMSHVSSSVSEKPVINFSWGSFAVDVFMLISGFLMMWHFYERRDLGENWFSSKSCLKFYVRRFFRIAPLYYCLLVVVYLFHDDLLQMHARSKELLHQPAIPWPHDPMNVGLTASDVLSHFSFVFGFIPRFAASTLLPDWSIGLEMQFYLFFPFLALLLVRSYFVGGVVLLLATNWASLHLFGVGINAEPKILGVFPMPTLLPFKINVFLVGMLLAAGLFEKTSQVKRYLLLLLGLAVAGIYMKKFFLVCFIFCCFEAAASSVPRLPALSRLVRPVNCFIGQKVFAFMADVSYGVYLIHAPVLFVTVRLLLKFCPFTDFTPAARFFLCLSVITPIVYALAFLAFKYIESPGIAWGRKIIKQSSWLNRTTIQSV